MDTISLIFTLLVCVGLFGLIVLMFLVSYLVYTRYTRKQLDSLINSLENIEHVTLLGIMSKTTRQFLLYSPWIPSDVHVFKNSLVITRYSEFHRSGRFRRLPLYLYRGEAKLVDMFPNFQIRSIYNIWVDGSELVIEYKYPAFVEVRAQLRLRGVVDSGQFAEIKKLLDF